MKRMWSKNELKNISKEVIESGQVSNAKPIYCHPITINRQNINSDGINIRLTCLIFNNDHTPFTLTSLKTWFDNLVATTNERARIMCSGLANKWKATASDTPQAAMLVLSSLDKFETPSAYSLQGVIATGDNSGALSAFSDASWDILFPTGTELVDGVNKIN